MSIEIEGNPIKRFRIYKCDSKGNPCELVAEYDSIAEVKGHRWRPDRIDKIQVIEQGSRKFLTAPEFAIWMKQHFWTCEFCGQTIELGQQLPQGYFDTCKLRDHLIGDECIARLDPDGARRLLRL
jgi:hypothetical protein